MTTIQLVDINVIRHALEQKCINTPIGTMYGRISFKEIDNVLKQVDVIKCCPYCGVEFIDGSGEGTDA